MSKPILDKAEVSIDFPDKFYQGSFGHSSSYEVKLDDQGVHIALDRPREEQRHVALHLHPYLFSGILVSLAEELAEHDGVSEEHRQQLKEAVTKLAKAL